MTTSRSEALMFLALLLAAVALGLVCNYTGGWQ